MLDFYFALLAFPQLWECVMSDFQRVLRIVSTIFVASLVIAACLTALDAWSHLPLADFLVKKLADIMLVCVSGIGGLLAGQKLEKNRH